jgi:hypothetical protein
VSVTDTTPALSGRRAIEQALAQARTRLTELVPRAIDTLEDLMENAQQEPVRLGAARDLLDRAGVTVKTQLEVDAHVTGDVDAKVTDLLGQLAKNQAARARRELELERRREELAAESMVAVAAEVASDGVELPGAGAPPAEEA